MKPKKPPVSHSDYAQELRGALPTLAFAAAPRKLWLLLVHFLIVTSGYVGFRNGSSVPVFVMLSLGIAHSMACIAFLAHELSHNAIVRSRPLRHGLEVFFWALNLIPATVWRRVHNQTHHAHTNTAEAPDRQFLKSEESFLTRWYARLFYPHRHTLRWNPLVAFLFDQLHDRGPNEHLRVGGDPKQRASRIHELALGEIRIPIALVQHDPPVPNHDHHGAGEVMSLTLRLHQPVNPTLQGLWLPRVGQWLRQDRQPHEKPDSDQYRRRKTPNEPGPGNWSTAHHLGQSEFSRRNRPRSCSSLGPVEFRTRTVLPG